MVFLAFLLEAEGPNNNGVTFDISQRCDDLGRQQTQAAKRRSCRKYVNVCSSGGSGRRWQQQQQAAPGKVDGQKNNSRTNVKDAGQGSYSREQE